MKKDMSQDLLMLWWSVIENSQFIGDSCTKFIPDISSDLDGILFNFHILEVGNPDNYEFQQFETTYKLTEDEFVTFKHKVINHINYLANFSYSRDNQSEYEEYLEQKEPYSDCRDV